MKRGRELGMFSLEEAQGRSYQCMQVCDEREWRKGTPFQWCPVMTRGHGHKLKRESPSEDKKTSFYCEGGQIQEQVPQRSWVISSCGDTENPNRHSPGLPFQVTLLEQDWPTWSRGPFQPKGLCEKKQQTPTEKKLRLHSAAGRLEPKPALRLVHRYTQPSPLCVATNSPTTLKLIHLCWWHWRCERRYCCKQRHSMVTCTVLFRTWENTLHTHFVGGVINCSGLAHRVTKCSVGEGNKQPKEKETGLFKELKWGLEGWSQQLPEELCFWESAIQSFLA